MPVKFRCYRCNQLLGVSRSKVGAIISCPKCGSALVVPDPDEETAPVARSLRPTLGAFVSAGTQDSEGLINLRPEDIRVEPGIELLTAAGGEEPDSVEIASAPVPAVETEAPPREPVRDAPVPPAAADAPAVTPAPAPEAPVPIQVPEGVRTYESYGRIRARDVVLPRSVVLAWSLLVLMAVAFAFGAGLLAGHFIWRVHEPVNRLVAPPLR